MLDSSGKISEQMFMRPLLAPRDFAEMNSFDTGYQYTLLEKAVAEVLTTQLAHCRWKTA